MKRNSLFPPAPFSAGAAVMFLLAACSPSADLTPATSAKPASFSLPQDQRQKIHNQVVSVTVFRRTIETTGTVDFNNDRATQVLAPISGPVVRLLASLGTRVQAGDPLATITSPDFAADVSAYRKALAAARNTRRIADQDKELFRNDAIARRELEQAETDAVSAEADRDAALQQLAALGVDKKTMDDIHENRPITDPVGIIRSPIAGVVVERFITPGQLLQAGTTLCFTVADLSTVWVMANAFESDIPFIAKADPADILTSVSPTPIPGKVDYIGAIVDPATRAVAVRILADNPGAVLKKQLYVRVAIHSQRDSTGLLVPVSAVLRDDDNLPFVYTENADGSFGRHRISLGSRIDDRYEVVSGLPVGERVVVEGGLFMQFVQSQ
ncbi:MAG: efflux RND transporter periplasmic adaptor subunit [Limisphaerales bacterium]